MDSSTIVGAIIGIAFFVLVAILKIKSRRK